MKKNVGKLDRMLRIIFGLFLLWVGLVHLKALQGGILGIIVALLSLIPFSTAATRFCPVFSLFKISSMTKRDKKIIH